MSDSAFCVALWGQSIIIGKLQFAIRILRLVPIFPKKKRIILIYHINQVVEEAQIR